MSTSDDPRSNPKPGWPVRLLASRHGWILPLLHDPDGHEVRFYSIESHTELDPANPLVIDDAIATARAREAEWLADRAVSGGV